MPAELERLDLPFDASGRSDTLLVLLAGAYDGPQLFIDHGLPDDCRAAGLRADLCLVRTDLAAVADGGMVAALQRQILAPARAQGYRRLLLGGISIGALVTLIHQDEHPGSVEALLLIAPYPGNRAITGLIRDAGGPARWQPGPLGHDDGELRAWRALRSIASAGTPPLWLGHGAQDRFADAHRMMGGLLPAAQVCAVEGGHAWPVWAQLWRRWLHREGAP